MRNEDNSFTEDVCHGKRRGYLTSSFCWDSEDTEGRESSAIILFPQQGGEPRYQISTVH